MKKIKLVILALAACVALTAATCNPGQQRTAFNAIYTTEQTVNTAYSAYLDLVIKGAVKTNDVPKVSLAYNLFQQAAAQATAFITTNAAGGVPAAFNQAAGAALNTIADAKGGK